MKKLNLSELCSLVPKWFRAVGCLMTCSLFVGLMAPSGYADSVEAVGVSTDIPSVTVTTASPAEVAAVADGLLAGKVMTGATLRDLINGEWLLGAEAPIYKKYYVSADLGAAYPVSGANSHGLYYVSGRVWAGQLAYDSIPLVKNWADTTSWTAAILQYGTVGVWGARDFDYGVWRAGYDVGFTVKFRTFGN